MDDLGRISHALRSPLTGLSALVEMLAGGVDGELNAAQASRIGRIRQSIDRLNSLVDQIAIRARAGSGKVELPRSFVDLGEVLLLAAEDVDRLSGGRSVELTVRTRSELPAVWADGARLRQIMRLLILECAGCSPGSPLEIAAESDGTAVTVSVSAADGALAGFTLPARPVLPSPSTRQPTPRSPRA